MRDRALLRTLGASLLLTTLFGLSPRRAAAQQQGFALDRLDPADRGSEWFVNDSLDLRGHFRPALGLVGSWGYKPLVIYNADGSENRDLVEHQIMLHAAGSLVLWDTVRVGLDMPIALYQTGDDVMTPGTSLSAPGSQLGDLRADADVRLLGRYGDPLRLAFGAALYLPTGSRSNYTGDGTVRVSPRASVAGDVAFVAYAARLGVDYRPLTEAAGQDALGSELSLAASAGVRLADKKLLVGPELFGSSTFDAFLAKRSTPLEWLVGAHYVWTDFRFGLGLGSGLTRGWGSPVFRMAASAEWAPGYDEDTDKDGIPDREDACPKVPGVRSADPRKNGCPPEAPPAPPPDRDGDGIPDALDACPDTPGVASADPKKNGCPSDRDNDGVPDVVDACPDVPGVMSEDPKKNGCPPDRDGDGIPDAVDACPDVPGVASEDPKKNGCPSDRDNDGIPDAADACPDVPGPANPDPSKNGCPLARIEGGEVKIIQQINFKTNSAEILRDSDPVLIAVGTILKEHPEITKVEVQGHTDNRGAPAYNKQLSQQRAESVIKWLTSYGIEKKRLVGRGYGQTVPIDTNTTDEGRAKNRRVEFHIETKAPATPAAPAPKP